MINTLDGVVKKRGEKVWEIGATRSGVLVPTMGVVHHPTRGVTNPNECWHSYTCCLDACVEINNGKKTIFDLKK